MKYFACAAFILVAGCTQDLSPRPPAPNAETRALNPDFKMEGVDFPDPKRRSHGLMVLAADAKGAEQAVNAFREGVKKEIAKLPPTAAGRDAGLYLFWGHYPSPSLQLRDLRATYDEKARLIRVTLPPWTGRPMGGIGMDWGVDPRLNWPFLGFRLRLGDLPAGDYGYEVIEFDPKAPAAPPRRELASGRFTLLR